MTEARAKYLLPFAIFIAILSVSTASIFIRYAQNEGTPSLGIAALRLSFATLMLAPVALIRHRAELARLNPITLWLGAASGVFLAIHFATWISSLEYASVASSVVFVSTGPLWVAILSPMLLKERMSRAALFGLGFALLGGILIALEGACAITSNGLNCSALGNILQGQAMWGNFLALLGAWAVTGYLIIGRKLRAEMSLVPYIFFVYGAASVTLLIILWATHTPLTGYTPKAYGWIFLLAALPQLVGHSTYNWALRYLPAALVAITTLGEPIGSAILAFFLLNETPSLTVLLGGGLILFGIYLASRR